MIQTKIDLKIKKVNIKMEESFINLFEKFNSQLLKDYKDKIRTNIYKELDELRKKDYEFSKRLEIEESNLWFNLLRGHKYSTLNNLVNIYDCLINLKCVINRFKDLVNTD